MFCPNCGAEITADLKNCVFCDTSLDIVHTILLENAYDKLTSIFPNLSECRSCTVHFMGKELHYEARFEKIKLINTIINKITKKDCIEFEEYVKQRGWFKSFATDVPEKGENILKGAKYALGAFVKKNAGEKALKKFLNKDISYLYCDMTYSVQELVEDVELATGAAREIRNIQKNATNQVPHGRWIGGGFGIGGALKGAVNAAILNAGTGAVRNVASALNSVLQESADKKKIDKLKKELRDALCPEMINAFRECYEELGEAVREELLQKGYVDAYNSDRVYDFMENLNKNRSLTFDECSDEILYILGNYPFHTEIYQMLYAIENGRMGKDLSNLAKLFVDETIVQDDFVQLDLEATENNKVSIDDDYAELQRKWKTLKPREEINPAYNNEIFFDSKEALKVKDNLIRLWTYIFRKDVISEICECEKVIDFNDIWELAETSKPIEYFVFRSYMIKYENEIYNADKEGFLKKSGELQSLIQKSNKLAMCIWANIMASISYECKENSEQYMQVIKMLSEKEYTLAQALMGEYYLIGSNGIKKNPARGEILLRKALWKGNPLAIGYFGKFYANGECGYKKDFTIADELLKIAEKYLVPFAMKEREKLRN